jgi:hypothetical protein
MPLQHRRGYAADLHRGLPTSDITQPRSSPRHPDGQSAVVVMVRVRAAIPAPIRQVRAGGSLERRSAAGSSRAPFRLACRARTIWQYWPASSLSGAASTLPGVSRIELLPPASPRRYDDTAVKVSHLHSVQQRLVALDVGDPQLVGVLDGEVAFEQVRCHCAGGESASFLPCRRR